MAVGRRGATPGVRQPGVGGLRTEIHEASRKVIINTSGLETVVQR